MNAKLSALAAFAFLAACDRAPAPVSDQVMVTDAMVRLPAVDGQPAAAYFTLRGGKTGDRLETVSSDKAASIELHENRMSNGMMTMQPLTGIDVPAKAVVAFAQGGRHAMLFGLDPAVKPAGTLKLSFVFQSGKTISVEAATFAAGDEMPEAEGHAGH